MALFLTDADVDRCITLAEMIPAIAEMQAHFGQGQAVNLTRRRVATPGGYLAVMGGALDYAGVLGVKTFTHTRSGYSFQVSLYDAATGALLLYTQANRLGQLRTGATTGVAVRHLANPGPLQVGIIGTGNQAGDQLRAVCAVREVSAVRAFSRNPDNRQAFAERMTADLGLPVRAAASNRDAVADCDVVIAIAAAQTPVVQGEWLSAGATVIGAGPTLRRFREVDDATIAGAHRHFVDSLDQAPLECGDIAAAVDLGLTQWSRFYELRHVVAGVIPGRTQPDAKIYCKLMGTGVADVAAAKLALERAQALGIGTELPL